MTRYIPTSIKSEGLSQFLDKTATTHCGFDYRDFRVMIKNNITNTSIAKAFGVSRHTVQRWRELFYEEEQGGVE